MPYLRKFIFLLLPLLLFLLGTLDGPRWGLLSLTGCYALDVLSHTGSSSLMSVTGIPVHRVFLYGPQQPPKGHPQGARKAYLSSSDSRPSPFCLAVSSALDMPPQCNFLATQVWPASRVAAQCWHQYYDTVSGDLTTKARKVHEPINTFIDSICELGCGPGLPSLSAAVLATQQQQQPKSSLKRIYSTDVDPLALQLVQEAARQQGIQLWETNKEHIQLEPVRLHTQRFDLIHSDCEIELPRADLYLLSDVFESNAVARGAARVCHYILSQSNSARIWVFCQSDRAQRQTFLDELQQLVTVSATSPAAEQSITSNSLDKIDWCWHNWQNPKNNANASTDHPGLRTSRLWLCNVEETQVLYA